MSRPSITTLPLVGTSSAPTMLRIVVLPLPDGPSTTTNSPASTPIDVRERDDGAGADRVLARNAVELNDRHRSIVLARFCPV